MRRPILSTTFVLALLIFLGGSQQPAEAGDWHIGGAFRVGGVHFSLAYDRSHRHHDSYYYRTRHRVGHEGYRCGSYCLKKSGHYYHHASCPLVRHHFRLHAFHPGRVWDHYAGPRYDRYPDRGRYYGHRDYGYRDRGHPDYGYRDRGRGYGKHGRGHRGHGYDPRYRYDHRSRHHRHDSRYCPYR